MEFDDHNYFSNPYSGEEEENNEDLGESEESNKGFGEEEEHDEDLGESEVSSEDFREEDEYIEGLGYEGEDYEDVPNDSVNLSNDNDETPSEPNVFGNLPFSIDFVAGNNSHNDLLNSTNSLRGDPLQEPSTEQINIDSHSNSRNDNIELVTVSCLLCVNHVHLNLNEEEGPAIINWRKERLQNFVNQTEIDSNTFQLPDQCTNRNSPLCNQCLQNIDKLFNIQKIRENIVAESFKNVIHKFVMCGDSLCLNTLTSPAETEKFNQLPKALIEVFREQKRREKLRHDAAQQAQWNSSVAGASQNVTATNGVINHGIIQSSPVVNPYELPIIIQNVEGGVVLTPLTTPSSSVASQNLSTSNDIRRGSSINIMPADAVEIKREAHQEQTPNDLDYSNYGSEVIQVQKRKKRLFAKEGNVEILDIPAALGKKAFLQCSICAHKIPTPKKRRGGKHTTALDDMHTHIRSQHKNEYLERRLTPAYKCKICHKPFRSRKARDNHVQDVCNGNVSILQKSKQVSLPIGNRATFKAVQGSTSSQVTSSNCAKVGIGRKHGISNQRSHKTKAEASNNNKKNSASPAFSAPSTSAGLVRSETKKKTRLRQKSLNAVSQQPTLPNTRSQQIRLRSQRKHTSQNK